MMYIADPSHCGQMVVMGTRQGGAPLLAVRKVCPGYISLNSNNQVNFNCVKTHENCGCGCCYCCCCFCSQYWVQYQGSTRLSSKVFSLVRFQTFQFLPLCQGLGLNIGGGMGSWKGREVYFLGQDQSTYQILASY